MSAAGNSRQGLPSLERRRDMRALKSYFLDCIAEPEGSFLLLRTTSILMSGYMGSMSRSQMEFERDKLLSSQYLIGKSDFSLFALFGFQLASHLLCPQASHKFFESDLEAGGV